MQKCSLHIYFANFAKDMKSQTFMLKLVLLYTSYTQTKKYGKNMQNLKMQTFLFANISAFTVISRYMF